MKRNSVMILDEINTKKEEARSIVNLAKTENRELTDEEQEKVEELKKEIKACEDELHELEEKAKRADEEDENKETPSATDDENKEENKRMKHNFSLLGAIRSVVDNKNFDATTKAMIEAGKTEARGLNIAGQIQLPIEKRTVTITGEDGTHDEVVTTDMMNILDPLHHKMILSELGVKTLTGLQGDVLYPILGAGAAEWEGENTEADQWDPEVTSVKLQPKRMAATITLSKQFIMQDSVGAEQAIRNELVTAIANKLEATIWGDAAGSTTKPQGIFYQTSNTVENFADICELEADLEANKFFGEMKYAMAPSAKASLRGMIKGHNNTGMVFENGEVDGTPAAVTGHISGKRIAYGKWDQCVLANWGALDLVIDPYTRAKYNEVVITVNSYWDFKKLRNEAITTATIAGGDDPQS